VAAAGIKLLTLGLMRQVVYHCVTATSGNRAN